MADWSHPVLSDSYSSVLTTHLTGRDFDALSLCNVDPTNIPDHAIKYDRSTNKFRERIGGVWVDLALAVVGGGTGSNTAAGARTNLGLGTIATQDASNVTITGGSLDGATLNLGSIPVGYFLRRASSSNLEWTNDGSGLTGAGLLQHKFNSISAQQFLSPVNTFLSVISQNITPASNTYRVRIEGCVSCHLRMVGFPTLWSGQIDLQVYRGGTLVQEFDAVLSAALNTISTDGTKQTTSAWSTQVYIATIDTPVSTSALTYTIYARFNGNNMVGYINYNLGTMGTTITLTELGPN